MSAPTPLPGDVNVILKEAEKLRNAAADMKQGAERLGHVASFAGYSSGAVKAASKNAADLKKQISHAEVRYRGAGNALRTWSHKLDAAQQQAEKAIAAYNSVGSTAGASAKRDQAIHHMQDPTLPDAEREAARTDLQHANAALDHMNSQLAAAKKLYNDAVHDRDVAAHEAVSAIRDAIDASDLDDSWWDKAKHSVGSTWKGILRVLQDIADFVAVVATVLAVVCLVLSVAFPFLLPIAGLLFTISRIASAVSAAISVIRFLVGDMSMKELVIRLAFAAAGGLLKVGKLGRVAKGLGKAKPFRGAMAKVFRESLTGRRINALASLRKAGSPLTRVKRVFEVRFKGVGRTGEGNPLAPLKEARRLYGKPNNVLTNRVETYYRNQMKQAAMNELLHLPKALPTVKSYVNSDGHSVTFNFGVGHVTVSGMDSGGAEISAGHDFAPGGQEASTSVITR